MQTKPKSNSVVTHGLGEDGQSIVFAVKDAGTIRLDLTKLSDMVKDRAAIHGLIQRVSDRAAISRNTSTGLPATAQEKFEAMKELVEFYHTGTELWNMARSSGAVGPGTETILLTTALKELYPARTEEQLKDWLAKRSKVERAALMTSEAIKPIVERIRGEMAKDVKVEELLSDLGTEE